MQEFKTIKAGCEPLGTYAEKSSKFIAYLSRATCKSEAQTYIEQKRAEHPHARHVCSAWLYLRVSRMCPMMESLLKLQEFPYYLCYNIMSYKLV